VGRAGQGPAVAACVTVVGDLAAMPIVRRRAETAGGGRRHHVVLSEPREQLHLMIGETAGGHAGHPPKKGHHPDHPAGPDDKHP
jgi:NADPH-dependent ferric siderophore reductase